MDPASPCMRRTIDRPHPSYPWPTVNNVTPRWTASGFSLHGRHCAVLDFEAGESGWSEDLTQFHEEATSEGQHPIDVASRRRARAALRRHLSTDPSELVLLEAGCSSGFLLRELVHEWPDSLVIGSDYLLEPLKVLARRLPHVPLLRFDLVTCPLPSASVDAVVLLNVLEHIEDHVAAMGQVARVLRPGGIAVVEVPAGPGLYDVYDRYLHHFRRYHLGELARLAEDAGLTVIERSHLGFFVYPAFVAVKRRNRRWLDAPEAVQRAKVEQAIRSSGSGPLLRWAMAVEERLAPMVSYPVGIRCVIAASKRGR